MADIQSSDELLVNRGNVTYTQQQGTLMANLENTDYLLLNRSDTTYKITGQELIDSVIDPLTLTVVISPDPAIVEQSAAATAIPAGGKGPYTILSYQWYIADDINGSGESILTGETQSTYTPITSFINRFLGCKVTVNDTRGITATATTYSGPLTILEQSPIISSVILTESTNPNDWTGSQFIVDTQLEQGTDPLLYALKPYVTGNLLTKVASSAITNVDPAGNFDANTSTITNVGDDGLFTFSLDSCSPLLTQYSMSSGGGGPVPSDFSTYGPGLIDFAYNSVPGSPYTSFGGSSTDGAVASVIVTTVFTFSYTNGPGVFNYQNGATSSGSWVAAGDCVPASSGVDGLQYVNMPIELNQASGTFTLTCTPSGTMSIFGFGGSEGSGDSVLTFTNNTDLQYFKAGDVVQGDPYQGQVFSSNAVTTGNNTGNVGPNGWWGAFPATNQFDGTLTNYSHPNGNGGPVKVTQTFNPPISCTSKLEFLGGLTSNSTTDDATISINGGTPVSLTVIAGVDPAATDITEVAFSGLISEIVLDEPTTGAGLLCFGYKVDGNLLIDSSVNNLPAATIIAIDGSVPSVTVDGGNWLGSDGTGTAGGDTTLSSTIYYDAGLTFADNTDLNNFNPGAPIIMAGPTPYQPVSSTITKVEDNGANITLTLTDDTDLKYFRVGDNVQGDDWNQAQEWSSQVVNSGTGLNQGPISVAFNGTVGPGPADERVAPLAGQSLTLPISGITTDSTVTVVGSVVGVAGNLEINGTPVDMPNGGAPATNTYTSADVPSLANGVTSIKWFYNSGYLYLQGIYINGKLLVNQSIVDSTKATIVDINDSVPSITVSGGSWTGADGSGDVALNKSQEWSDGADGNRETYPVTNAFNGSLTTYAYTEAAQVITVTLPGGSIPLTSLRVYTDSITDGSGLATFFVNGNDYTSQLQQGGGWNTITGETQITSIGYLSQNFVSIYTGLSAVEVNGKILVDTSVPGDGGETEVTSQSLKNPTGYTVASTDVATKTMKVNKVAPTLEDVWVANDNQAGASFTVETTTVVEVNKLYCKMQQNTGNVISLQSSDPGYTEQVGAPPSTITFPNTFPNGLTPDATFPTGSMLCIDAQVSNNLSSDEMKAVESGACLQPGFKLSGPIVDSGNDPTLVFDSATSTLVNFEEGDSAYMADASGNVASYTPSTSTITKVAPGGSSVYAYEMTSNPWNYVGGSGAFTVSYDANGDEVLIADNKWYRAETAATSTLEFTPAIEFDSTLEIATYSTRTNTAHTAHFDDGSTVSLTPGVSTGDVTDLLAAINQTAPAKALTKIVFEGDNANNTSFGFMGIIVDNKILSLQAGDVTSGSIGRPGILVEFADAIDVKFFDRGDVIQDKDPGNSNSATVISVNANESPASIVVDGGFWEGSDGSTSDNFWDTSVTWSQQANQASNTTYGPNSQAFDGNPSTSNQVSGNYADAGTTSAVVFNLTPVPVGELVEIKVNCHPNGASLVCNGSTFAATSGVKQCGVTTSNTLTITQNVITGSTDYGTRLYWVKVGGKLLVDTGITGAPVADTSMTSPVKSGTGTFGTAAGTSITLSSTNNEWIDNTNRSGTDFYMKSDTETFFLNDDSLHISTVADIKAAFDAYEPAVNERRTSIASSAYRLAAGESLTTSEITALLSTVTTAVNVTEPFALDGYYPLYSTAAAANAASSLNANHTHNLGSVTYYMPDGGTIYHGDYVEPEDVSGY